MKTIGNTAVGKWIAKLTAGVAVAMLTLSAAGPGRAHHSLALFDTDTPVTIAGTIVRFEKINPHSYLYVEQETADGPATWAIDTATSSRNRHPRSSVIVLLDCSSN